MVQYLRQRGGSAVLAEVGGRFNVTKTKLIASGFVVSDSDEEGQRAIKLPEPANTDLLAGVHCSSHGASRGWLARPPDGRRLGAAGGCCHAAGPLADGSTRFVSHQDRGQSWPCQPQHPRRSWI